MSDKQTFYLVHDTARANAARAVHDAPDGYVCSIQEQKKSRIQEEKYHAMIDDISDQCMFMGRKWDSEEWKRLLIDAFVRVMRQNAIAAGEPDPFPDEGQVVPALDGHGFVQLGVQSRGFRKSIASAFIEHLYAYGAENGVEWSERVRQWDEVTHGT